MTIYASRRKKLLSGAEGRAVVAATSGNLFYATGFFGGGMGIVRPDRTTVVTSRLEEDRASETGHEIEVIVVGKGSEVPAAVVKELGGEPGVVDDDSEFPPGKLLRMPEIYLEARRVKDDTEVAKIAKASSGLDKIFAVLEDEIRPGRSEWEVAAEVMRVATLNGLTPNGFDGTLSPTILASGENGALPHSELTGRKIRKGDSVVADISFRFEGYNSDATRTFMVGSVAPAVRKSYAAVKEAQEESLAKIAPGERLGLVAETAVAVLEKHGVAKHLNHSIGHGVGIDIHEMPRIGVGNMGRLERNEVVTDEPGVYFKGKFGIRIEDTARVGSKAELLTTFTRDMITLG